MIRKGIDRGTAWVLRWFAKPVVTGSIPAPVSKVRRFPQDYEWRELADLVVLHRNATIEAKTALSETRDRLVAAQRELSAIKRKTNQP